MISVFPSIVLLDSKSCCYFDYLCIHALAAGEVWTLLLCHPNFLNLSSSLVSRAYWDITWHVTREMWKASRRQWHVIESGTALSFWRVNRAKGNHGKSVLNVGRIRRIIVLSVKPFVDFELLVLLEDVFMCDFQKWWDAGQWRHWV